MSVEEQRDVGHPMETTLAVPLRRVLWERAEVRGGVSHGACELGPGPRIRPIILPARFQCSLDRVERAYIGAAMECARQDPTKAARLLGVDRQALDEKLRGNSGMEKTALMARTR